MWVKQLSECPFVVVSVRARYCSSVIKDKLTGLNFGTWVIAQYPVVQHVSATYKFKQDTCKCA